MPDWDFRGWATKNDVLCTDGRTIRRDAFKECDGKKVPLIWMHQHHDPENTIGHAILENRDEGVYAYGKLNASPKAQATRYALENGDLDSLSIYANQLRQNGTDVIHGNIRELSIVLAGANAEAQIEAVLEHGDGTYEEAYYTTNTLIELRHDDESAEIENEEEEEAMTIQQAIASMTDEQRDAMYTLITAVGDESTIQHSGIQEDLSDVVASMNEVQQNAMYMLIQEAMSQQSMSHADEEEEPEEEDAGDMTVGDIINTMSQKQKNAMYAVIAELMNSAQGSGEVSHSGLGEDVADAFESMNEMQQNAVYAVVAQVQEQIDNGEFDLDEDEDDDLDSEEYDEEDTPDMKHNAFETEYDNNDTLVHDALNAVAMDIKTYGSLRESMIQHGIENVENITNIGYLFPDAKTLDVPPAFITRDMGWVQKVMSGVRRTPFSRIKSLFADLTEDEARARGYFKGNLKKNEVFTILKRATSPTTVYKKQKFERDDIVDITGFDVVAWIRGEMRMMLDEELARAFLIGDGRESASDDKIAEENIRPIWTDESLFTINTVIQVASDASSDAVAKELIRGSVRSRKDYKGSGNLVFFTSDDYLADMLLMEDTTGRVIYDSEDKLKSALRVKDIVTVPVMDNQTRQVDGTTRKLAGILVDLSDYIVGADKGGAVNMFDQFDIDYNAQKYLIETRCSAALTKPFSAIVLEVVTI